MFEKLEPDDDPIVNAVLAEAEAQELENDLIESGMMELLK
jgi:hypothetical protein